MNENLNPKGSKSYLFSIVMVAVLGGLLFGYDTAVISGAEKGLQAFFLGATDFGYTDFHHGLTSSSALLGCIIGSAISGILASNLGRKRTLIIAGVLFFVSALGSMEPEMFIFERGVPHYDLLVMFNFYRIIGGVGVGLASAVCPMYIGEVSPSVSWLSISLISLSSATTKCLRYRVLAWVLTKYCLIATLGLSLQAGAICLVPK